MKRVDNIIHHELFRNTLHEMNQWEKDRIFCHHNIEHLLSVARIMLLLAAEEGIAMQKDVLYATALLHDLGRIYQYQNGEDHAMAGIHLAQEILKESSYTQEEQDAMIEAILNHNKKEVSNELGRLLQKADKLSRNCFLCLAREECYWAEMEKNQGVIL